MEKLTNSDLAECLERTTHDSRTHRFLIELQERRACPESPRDVRQKEVADWCAAAFGTDHAASVPQRGIRLAEEAIEAAQAAGCDPAMVHRLIDHVFAKPPGLMNQEIGGVGITVLALAQACGLSADAEESRELARVTAKPLSHFAAGNKAKNDAGFNVTGKSVQAELLAAAKAKLKDCREYGDCANTDPALSGFYSDECIALDAAIRRAEGGK